MKEFATSNETPVPVPQIDRQEKTVFSSLDANLGVDEKNTEKLLQEMDSYFAKYGGIKEEEFGSYIHRISALFPKMIVRRENPDELFNALETNDSVKIRFREDAHGGVAYPNAAEIGWDGSGLRIPYQWGFGKVGEGKVVMVIGFTPNANEVLNAPIPPNSYPGYTDPMVRGKLRMIEGDIDMKNDLKFAIVRFPRKFFPESEMTDKELDQEEVFHISRVYSFGDDIKKESH